MICPCLQRLPPALYHHGRDDHPAGHPHHVRPLAHGVHPGQHHDGDHDGDEQDQLDGFF